MNFRLAELARKFTDITNHLTSQPFTWGAGTGDIEDQTDLATALGEKADKANTYTKKESDDLLDGKFDKSGGTIEGVTIIETDSPDGLEIVRTGQYSGRARLRVVGTGSSGLSPELLISGDTASETPGLPLYVPGRISTRDGFYIGATRKDQEWDAKADQTALDDTNQVISDLFTTDIEMALATQGATVGLENNRPQIVARAGNIHTIDFQINVTSNAGGSTNFVLLTGITGLENSQVLGHFFTNADPVHTGFFYVGNQNTFGSGAILVYLEGSDGILRVNHPILQPGVQWRGQLTFSRNI